MDGISELGVNQDLQSYNLFIYCSNNPVAYVDPMGTFNWGNLAITMIGVAAVTALCVFTAGAAAPLIGVSVATAKVATASACLIAASVSFIDQYAENGDVSDPQEIVQDTLDSGIESMAELTGPVGSFVYTSSELAVTTIYDTIKRNQYF